MLTYTHHFNGDYSIKRGSTWIKVITWNNPDGTPVDLTGYTAAMQLREAAGDTVVADLTTENGRITLGGTLGTITLELTPDYTYAIPAGKYLYDLELTIEDSAEETTYAILEGYVKVKDNITVEETSNP